MTRLVCPHGPSKLPTRVDSDTTALLNGGRGEIGCGERVGIGSLGGVSWLSIDASLRIRGANTVTPWARSLSKRADLLFGAEREARLGHTGLSQTRSLHGAPGGECWCDQKRER